jgi:uncharacterized protein involved in exopolysaccharide biosynthesis
MEITTFLKILKKRQGTVLGIVLIFLAVTSIFTLVQTLKYRAVSRLLIVQEGTLSDPYTVAKSNQYISSLMAEAVSSGSFFQSLSAANSSYINWNYFQGDYKQQLKVWKKTIVAKNISDTGVLEVSIYHPDPEQARQLALAVNNAIINQNNNYQGLSGVKIKVIDEPTVSSYPVKPNLLLNVGAALIFGLIFGGLYIYSFPLSRKDKRRLLLNDRRSENRETEHRQAERREPISHRLPERHPETEERSSFSGDIHNIINR